MKTMNSYLKSWVIFSASILSANQALAQQADPETTSTVLGEVENFGEFISLIWNFSSQFILGLAILFIVVGAFFYVGSGGNQDRIDQGRQMIFGSIIATLMVIFSGVLIRTLFQSSVGTTGYLTDIPNVLNNATLILMSILGAYTVIMFIYAAYLYVTSQGEVEKMIQANRSLRYAVLGLLIGLSAYGLITTILNNFL